MLRSLIVIALLTLAASAEDRPKRPGPAAHYVIRTSDLATTLAFAERVLGLHVLRHEENPEACPITCNGDYAVPWSKTMVGTAPEDEAYALEITYNYGVASYEIGAGLAGFEMYVDDVPAALAAAAELGYVAEDGRLAGPDGYRFALFPRPEGRREVFRAVRFDVFAPGRAARWYIRMLGMKGPPEWPAGTGGAQVRYAGDTHEGVVFYFDKGKKGAAVRQFDGRNAFSLPAAKVRKIYQKLQRMHPERIVHDLQEINEETGLGVLLIAIITDPNGLEICLVSSEAFEPAVRAAADYVGPDYKARERLALDYAEKLARAKAQKPDFFGWATEL